MSGTDLISRADAIEAVEHITSSMSVCVNTDECHGMKRMQRQAVIELANIPSAQKTQLSTEDTTFDCISRQMAIDEVRNYYDPEDTSVTSIEDRIKRLPSAQPQWIPCSERLPEEDTYVLATTAWGEITMAEKLSDVAWFIYEGNANAKSDDIVAWMPLPAPWKGEQPC